MAKKQNQAAQDTYREQEQTAGQPVNVQTILLGIIALALVIQTFLMLTDDGGSAPAYVPSNGAVVAPAASAMPAAANPITSTPVATAPQNTAQPAAQPAASNTPTFSVGDGNATTATYSATSHNFGTLSASDGPKEHTFTVTNAGGQPLSYTQVRGDAGVTVLSYPTAPIPPGGKGEIKVQLNPAALAGQGTKTIKVHCDANTNPGHQDLLIQATVN